MNHSDGERIAAVLDAMGYQPAEKEEDAQILGLVACSVRQKAIDRVYTRITVWNEWKYQRPILTFVSGCILDEDRLKFLERFDMVFALKDVAQLPAMIAQYGVPLSGAHNVNIALDYVPRDYKGLTEKKRLRLAQRRESGRQIMAATQKKIAAAGGASLITRDYLLNPTKTSPLLGGFWNLLPHYRSTIEASIPIQNGCNKFCTYCAVPYTRGREISRPSAEILAEIQSLVKKGYRSITLLGQNVNSYGQDRQGNEIDFTALLEQIGQLSLTIDQKFWIYFTAPHPRDMDSSVLHTIARYPCLAKQIHLPLQSGADTVLERMNRRHNVSRYRAIISDIRSILPTATLWSDIIVGFTAETEAEFAATSSALEEFKYNMVFISPYSPRPGATSANWADDVSNATKKERFNRLNEILHRTSRQYTESRLGLTETILIHSSDPQYLYGYTEGRISVRLPIDNAQALGLEGQFVRGRVEKVKAMSMECQLVAE